MLSDETIRFYKIFGLNRAHDYPAIGLGGGRVVEDQDLELMSEMR